jgi:hypothetical protein
MTPKPQTSKPVYYLNQNYAYALPYPEYVPKHLLTGYHSKIVI